MPQEQVIPPPDELMQGRQIWNNSSYNGENNPIRIANYAFQDCDFRGYIFRGAVTFSNCEFPDNLIFAGAFNNGASFVRSTFLGSCKFDAPTFNQVSFANAKFCGPVDMHLDATGSIDLNETEAAQRFTFANARGDASIECRQATFHAGTSFRGSYRDADFTDAKFRQVATFSIEVERLAKFAGAEFKNLSMQRCIFRGGLEFGGGICEDESLFTNSDFGSELRCIGRQFRGNVDFSSSDPAFESMPRARFDRTLFNESATFNGRKFRGNTSFRGATFRKAPAFHNCHLFPHTDFRDCDFQDFASSDAEACYRSLRQGCKNIESHHDEILFFTREMRARRMAERNKAATALYRLYELSSNYGLSIRRPVFFFLSLQGVAFLIYWALSNAAQFGGITCPSSRYCFFDWETFLQLFSFTGSHAVPFPAFRDATILKLWPTPGALRFTAQVIAIFHALFSVVLLFLIGLGIRNMFKLK